MYQFNSINLQRSVSMSHVSIPKMLKGISCVVNLCPAMPERRCKIRGKGFLFYSFTEEK